MSATKNISTRDHWRWGLLVACLSTRDHWRWGLLVACLATLPYLNSLAGGYAFDDVWMIVHNPIVQTRDVAAALTQAVDPGPVYRPVVLLSYVLNQWLGANLFGYHLFNVLLHACASAAVYLLFVALLQGRVTDGQPAGFARRRETTSAALLGAILFAVHPIHAEAVANIVGRAEILSAITVVVTLLAFLRFLDAPARARGAYAIALLSCAIGPFAKENALTVIPMLAVVHHWREPSASLYRRGTLLLPFTLAAAFYIGLRLAITGALTYPEHFNVLDNVLANVPWWVRIPTAITILWDYVSLLAAPIVLSADYSYNQTPLVTSLFDPRFIGAIGVFTVVGGILLVFRQRAREVILGLLLAAIAIALTSNIPFAIGTVKAERLLYLPSIGWCFAAGWLASRAIRMRPKLWGPAFACLLLLLAARTWARNYDWRDNPTLYKATVETAPNSAKILCSLGIVMEQAGEREQAAEYFRRALEILPTYSEAAYQLGHLYQTGNLPAGALHWYARLLADYWEHPRAHLGIGVIRRALGEYDAAEAALRTGLEHEPDNPVLLVHLGATRLDQGDPWEAAGLMQRLAALEWVHPDRLDGIANMRWSIERELYGHAQPDPLNPTAPRGALRATQHAAMPSHRGS